MINHLEHILTTLAKRKVRFIVAGGVAAVIHGVERMTLDLDISLDMKSENIKRFIKTLELLNLKPRIPLPASVLFDSEKLDLLIKEKNALVFSFSDSEQPFRHIDVFLSDDFAYAKLITNSTKVTIGKQQIKIVSIRKLIEMKKAVRPMREKDKMDITLLETILKNKEI